MENAAGFVISTQRLDKDYDGVDALKYNIQVAKTSMVAKTPVVVMANCTYPAVDSSAFLGRMAK
jgi:hypothetical protein